MKTDPDDGRNILATYLIETAMPLEQVADILAGEQSSGTFVSLPGETPELQEKHGAEVRKLEVIGEVAAPSLPGPRHSPVNGSFEGAGI